MNNDETPPDGILRNKAATDDTERRYPKWVETDINGQPPRAKRDMIFIPYTKIFVWF